MNEKSMSENDRNELQKRISELPSIESIIDDEKARAGLESNLTGFSSEHVHIVLRGYVDDISFKVPRLLASHAVQILCILLRPTGARFSDKKRQQWDINKKPKGGERGREDPFARGIFLTSLCDNRTRMHLQEFRLSRAYFFGTLIRAGRNDDGSLRMYPCLLKNHNGRICNNLCDPFGHHGFVCKITTKQWITIRV